MDETIEALGMFDFGRVEHAGDGNPQRCSYVTRSGEGGPRCHCHRRCECDKEFAVACEASLLLVTLARECPPRPTWGKEGCGHRVEIMADMAV